MGRKEAWACYHKTEMCHHYRAGWCQKGALCTFAHNAADLRHKPDLIRTRLCRVYTNTGTCPKAQCNFAHSIAELRSHPGLPSNMHVTAMPELPDRRAAQHSAGSKEPPPPFRWAADTCSLGGVQLLKGWNTDWNITLKNTFLAFDEPEKFPLAPAHRARSCPTILPADELQLSRSSTF
mmetsp:Transcript_12059/g.28314  ORF Transcript_12059/g.28314 Transcript_12059/m.28314 type:complete len:179 (-) Transcript_12059:87-623(-)